MKRFYLVLLLVFAVAFSNVSGLSASEDSNAINETGTQQQTGAESNAGEETDHLVTETDKEDLQQSVETDTDDQSNEGFDLDSNNQTETAPKGENAKPGLGGVGPTAIPETGTDLGDIFDGITLTINDEVIKEDTIIDLAEQNTMSLSFHWSIEDGVNLTSGDWARIKVPEQFAAIGVAVTDNVEMTDKDGKVIGHFSVDDEGYLILVFNEALEGMDERSGISWFEIQLDLSKLGDDNLQEIIWDDKVDKDDIFIRVKPKNQQNAVYKAGQANASINPNYIDWVVDVNKNFAHLTDAQVKDLIPAGLVLDGNIQIEEIIYGIDASGNLVESSVNAKAPQAAFPVQLGDIETSYRLSFRTTIVDKSKTSFSNTAQLYDGDTVKGSATANVTGIEHGSMIEKNGVASPNPSSNPNTEKITWTIDFNKALASLDNAIIEDEIPGGLALIAGSIKVYNLNAQGSNWVVGSEVTDLDTASFPIEFGEINQAYRIVYETEVLPSWFVNEEGEFERNRTFINYADLYDGERFVDRDNAQIDVNRDELIGKTGREVTSYGDQFPVYEWTIKVNSAQQPIWYPYLEDALGDGLRLVLGSVTVSPDISNKVVKENSNGFSVALGDYIDDEVTITYRTTVIGTSIDAESFNNNYTLYGYLANDGPHGPGEGTGVAPDGEPGNRNPIESGGGTAVPSVVNTYAKSRLWYLLTPNGMVYDGVNNVNKTMSWRLEVDAVREAITSLVISDSFSPAKSMYFMKDTLQVFKNYGRDDQTLLVEGTHYTIADNGVDGFVLTFLPAGLSRAKYDIVYKSSFDPDVVLANNGVLNPTQNYKNLVKYEVITRKSDNSLRPLQTVNREAEYPIPEFMFNNGQKFGNLDRANRTVTWSLYINAMGQDLEGGFKVTDKLTGTAQELDQMSLKIYEFNVDVNGKPVPTTNEVDPETYVVNWIDEQEFEVTFTDGLARPVYLQFDSKLVGISESTYENTATVDYDGVVVDYDAEVSFDFFDEFIKKNTLGIGSGDRIYPNDEIQWQIVLNRSLSEIYDAVFSDTIAGGHVLVEGSIKLFPVTIDASNNITKGAEVTLPASSIRVNHGEDPSLEVDLGDINQAYVIEYATSVTGVVGDKIENAANLRGTGLSDEGKSDEVSWDISTKPGGTGSGTRHGSITITKIDSETKEAIVQNPAQFELYYLLNGQPVVVDHATNLTNNSQGRLVYGSLPMRTYYLVEKEAPAGYTLLSATPLEVTIAPGSSTQHISISIENTKQKVNYTAIKTWTNGPLVKPDIQLQLYRDAVAFGEPVLLASGQASYIWVGLDKTDNFGVPYVYTVDEVSVPEGYDKHVTHLADSNLTNIVNAYVIEKGDIAVTKVWEGGPSPRPSVTFQLYRDNLPLSGSVILNDGETSYTWENLDLNSQDGHYYEYEVREVAIGGTAIVDGEVTNHYLSSVTTMENQDNQFIATNTYVSPKIDIDVTKQWVGGPLSKPTITLRLLRQVGDEVVTVVEGSEVILTDPWTHTWEDLDENNFQGVPYVYSVEELDVFGYFVDITGDADTGFTVTNTFKNYAIGDYVWIDSNNDGLQDDDEEILDKVIVVLYDEDGEEISRTTTDENGFYLFDELAPGTYQVQFILTEQQQALYEFTKQNEGSDSEVDSDADVYTGYTSIIVLDDSNPFLVSNDEYENQTIKATVGIDPTWDAGVVLRARTSISVEKVWVGGPQVKPAVSIQLLRNGSPFGAPVSIDGSEDLPWVAIWDDLYVTDLEREPYTYTFAEVDAPENYEVDYDGFTITNTYVSPKTDLTVLKEWVGGPVVKPTILIQLYRDGVELGEPIELVDGETSYTWTDLDVTDGLGVAYEYTVKEVDVPEGYLVEVDGFTITNTRKTYAVGDYVWIDKNKNGLQDPNEAVLAGVIVELYDHAGKKVAETTTNEEGLYIFDELEAGEYQIRFILTASQKAMYSFTKVNANGNTAKDSDADQLTGWTQKFTLNDETAALTKDYLNQPFKATQGIDPTWDAGVILKELPSTGVNNLVWNVLGGSSFLGAGLYLLLKARKKDDN